MEKDERKIRQRAYEMWDRDGRPDGRSEDYWLKAEREIAGSDADAVGGSQIEASAPTQAAPPAKKTSNGAGAGPKPPVQAPRKRRGAQPAGQA